MNVYRARDLAQKLKDQGYEVEVKQIIGKWLGWRPTGPLHQADYIVVIHDDTGVRWT